MKARYIPRMCITEIIELPEDTDPRDITFYLVPVVQRSQRTEYNVKDKEVNE